MWGGGANVRHWDWWIKIVHQEERGVFGYHAAKQQYRIFQDIIKTIIVDLLEFEIKNDFHFFRIPLDPDLFENKSTADFFKMIPKPFDGYSPDRDQILSLNYTLFGNYTNGSQCTICYFSKNQSWFSIAYAKKLEFLFNELGLPISEIPALFNLGNSINDFETGVIYQFTDLSHQDPNLHAAYELVDRLAYPAIAAGPYDKNVHKNLSELFLSDRPAIFDLNTGQIRLIMNTADTLNPYSRISIRRYDQLSLKVVKDYENSLRAHIKLLPSDPLKVENYKQKLRAYWHVQD